MERQVANSGQSRMCLPVIALLAALLALAAAPALALADGKPDLSFGKKGTSAFDPDPLSLQSPSDMVTDSKGRIVMGGTTFNGPGGNMAWFTRLNRNGSVDSTFGTGGFTTFPVPAQTYIATVAVDSEGRIVAAGNYDLPMNRDIWVLRLKSDGHLDSGFGIGGGVGFDFGSFDLGYAAVVGKDGLIYVAASTGDGDSDKATVLRYTSDGDPDSTWGTGGAVRLEVGGTSSRAEAIRLDRRGRVVLGGERVNPDDSSDFLAIRLTRKGALDKTFNGRGFRTIRFMKGQRAEVSDMRVDGKGRILLLGAGDIAPDGLPDGLLARLTPNGKPDKSFGLSGKVVKSIFGTRMYLAHVRIDRAGRIVTAGYGRDPRNAEQALLIRFESNGRSDRSWGRNGVRKLTFGQPEGEGTAMTIDGKGRYLVGGYVFDTGLSYVTRLLVKYPRHR